MPTWVRSIVLRLEPLFNTFRPYSLTIWTTDINNEPQIHEENQVVQYIYQKINNEEMHLLKGRTTCGFLWPTNGLNICARRPEFNGRCCSKSCFMLLGLAPFMRVTEWVYVIWLWYWRPTKLHLLDRLFLVFGGLLRRSVVHYCTFRCNWSNASNASRSVGVLWWFTRFGCIRCNTSTTQHFPLGNRNSIGWNWNFFRACRTTKTNIYIYIVCASIRQRIG